MTYSEMKDYLHSNFDIIKSMILENTIGNGLVINNSIIRIGDVVIKKTGEFNLVPCVSMGTVKDLINHINSMIHRVV